MIHMNKGKCCMALMHCMERVHIHTHVLYHCDVLK